MREWIHGRNAVREVLLTNRREVFELQVAEGVQTSERMDDIFALARERKLKVTQVPRKNLDKRFGEKHGGLTLEASSYPYVSLDEVLSLAKLRGEAPFVLLLDVLQNPQNLGALLRTAEAVGIHGVVIPKARSAEVNPTVVNASSGATEHLLIVQANLSQTIAQLKQADVWVVGLDGGAGSQPIAEVRMARWRWWSVPKAKGCAPSPARNATSLPPCRWWGASNPSTRRSPVR